MDDLLIGDIVTWTISNKRRKGIFKQIIDGKAEIMCTECAGVPMAIKCFVEPSLIQAVKV